MEKFKPQIPVRYGIIASAAGITIGLLLYVFYATVLSSLFFAPAIGLLLLCFIIFLAIWSGITYRKENGGTVSFGHAFLSVYIVFLLNTLAGVGTQLLINKVIDPQYPDKASSLLKGKLEERFDKMNMTDDQIKEATKGVSREAFDPSFTKILLSTAGYLAFWAVISLIAAAFIKRGSDDLINAGVGSTV